jgi:hypothetical protein
MAEELVTWTREDGSESDPYLYGMTDSHMRGVPVLVPRSKRAMARWRSESTRVRGPVFPVRVSNPRLEAARERIAREALEEELFGL